MLLEPVDPNERFRDRRRQARQSRARRRIAVLTVFALSAAVVALGASFLNGRGPPTTTQADGAGDEATVQITEDRRDTGASDTSAATEPRNRP